MLKTWTDTHYKLEDKDWLYIAKHDDQGAASLVCPGYARDGQGFSIHFTPAHIEMLEQLLLVLRGCRDVAPNISTEADASGEEGRMWVEMYAACDDGESEQKTLKGNGYKYPDPSRENRHVIR